jgi:hypothetical protein
MKKIFYILLTMGVVFMPHAIYADIHSTTNASASTGGNVVSPNGSVTTGSENASVDVSNIVGDNGNGTSTINIESGTNGQTNHQTITKPIQSGRTSVTEYATSSTQGTSAGAHVKVLTHVSNGPFRMVCPNSCKTDLDVV